jgi:hypothetical protein
MAPRRALASRLSDGDRDLPLAERLGVKPMSVYHYVANKDEILNGIVDLVFGEIELPGLR